MRYALISDIHSNYTALSTALANMKRLMVDKIICLGDIVGYGAEPNECLAAVSSQCDYVIMGNHDHAMLNPKAAKTFNEEARVSIDWSRQNTKAKHMAFIEKLALKIKGPDFFCVHASPLNPEKWGYVTPGKMTGQEWNAFDTPLCFIGHSHIPMIITQKGKVEGPIIEIDPTQKYIINVGSIGQPRDGDRRLSFGIYDQEEGIFELIRLDYDYKKTITKIRKAGLPTYNSNRLLWGR